jgi:hypothetical protein
VEQLEDRLVPSSNVLVNDPGADHSAYTTQSETSIVLGADNQVIVAFNDSGSLVAGPHIVGYAVSSNGGAGFTDQGVLPGPSDGGDPVLARSSKTGTVFLADLDPPPSIFPPTEKVNLFRSTDNGLTFQSPINGAPGFTAGVDSQDKPSIAVDNYPGPGYGNVYLAFEDFSTDAPYNRILLTRSTDDGIGWGPNGGTPVVISGSNGSTKTFGAAFATVGPDHAVYVFWWDGVKGPELMMSKSTDQGQTFGDPVIVTGLKSHGYIGGLGLTDSSGRSFRTNAFPSVAVNPVTGDLYVAYADQANGSADKADIFFTESSDGGKKWSKPVRVNDDATNNDQWQPALAVTPDGNHLGIFWYDRRLDTANNLIDRFGAIGAVSGHGVSFAQNFRITDVSFPPAFGQEPFGPPDYMGDYDQAAADNSFFYTTWGDNRLGNSFYANQPDVRFAKVPVGGMGAFHGDSAAAESTGATSTESQTATASAFGFATHDIWAAATAFMPSQELLRTSGGATTWPAALSDLAPPDLLFASRAAMDREASLLRLAVDRTQRTEPSNCGETTKPITIEVKGDSKKEANETFYLDLFANSSNALFTRKRGVGTVLNDD